MSEMLGCMPFTADGLALMSRKTSLPMADHTEAEMAPAFAPAEAP
jgi:hypothetical protein